MHVENFAKTLTTLSKLITAAQLAYPAAEPKEIADHVLEAFGDKLHKVSEKLARLKKRKTITLQVRAQIAKAKEEYHTLQQVSALRDDILALLLKHCADDVVAFEEEDDEKQGDLLAA